MAKMEPEMLPVASLRANAHIQLTPDKRILAHGKRAGSILAAPLQQRII